MKRILFAIVSLFVLISCASAPVHTKDISNLKARIDAYNRARIDNDFKEAFQYEHVSLNEKFTEKLYITNLARSPVEWLEVSVRSIDIQESKDVAMVEIELTYKLLPVKGFEIFDQVQKRKIQDKWAYSEGNWYHIIQGVVRDW